MEVEPDQVMEDFEAHQQQVKALLQRCNKQRKDIHELQEELDKLEEEVGDCAISPEQWREHLRSGVAQS